MSFILEESSDDAPILEYVLDNETNIKTLKLVMRLRQARQEKMASSSSRRRRNKKRFIRRDREEARDRLYKDYFVEEYIYNETYFRR